MKQRRVMLYCRVSTEHQVKHGESITDQTEALHKWAEDNDCIVIGEYIDAGFSGAKPYTSRPEFCRMLREADELRPDLLLFTRLDRFTRNPRDYYNLAHTFEQHQLQWKAIWQEFDTTTPAGQAMIGTMVVFSKLERDNTSERIKAHNVEKRIRGELVSGNLPRGYMVKDKKPVKDPVTEQGMNAFFATYLSGQGLKKSIQAAAEHSVVFTSTSCASFVLRNAKSYTGYIQGVECEPYITMEQCNLILATRKQPIRKSDYPFIFHGIVKCSCCGGNFGAHRNFYKKKSGKGVQLYYNCTKHYNSTQGKCENKVNIYESDIEAYLLDHVQAALEAEKATTVFDEKEVDNSQAIKNLQNKRKRLVDLYIDALIEKDELSKRCIEIDSQIEELEKEQNIHEDKVQIDLPENWKDIYNQLESDGKREFWFSSLDAIYIHPDRSISFEFRH